MTHASHSILVGRHIGQLLGARTAALGCHATTYVAEDRRIMNAGRLHETKNRRLASLGAMLEYYDFVAYIYVAASISQAFFPAKDRKLCASCRPSGSMPSVSWSAP